MSEASGTNRLERFVMVGDGLPPEGKLVEVKCLDWWGDWYGMAMRKNYKRPPKGKSAKGFRKGWRWVYADGNVFDGTIEAWAETTP